MPRLNRVGNTLSHLARFTSREYAECFRRVYNSLSRTNKNTLSSNLSIGSTMAKNPKDPRRRERCRRLINQLATEQNFGLFGAALMKRVWEHAKIRDHWELERIALTTYYRMQQDIRPGNYIPGGGPHITIPQYTRWVKRKNKYGNSCGSFTSMLKEILPTGHNENLWATVVHDNNQTRFAACNHVNTTLNNNNWAYCRVMLGCHSFMFERVTGTNTARVIQVWSNMNVNPPPGFNYAYTVDKRWGLIVRNITTFRNAITNLINNVNVNQSIRIIIADPRTQWGIDPNRLAAAPNRINIWLETLATTDVDNDISGNINWLVNRQIMDYANGHLNIPNVN